MGKASTKPTRSAVSSLQRPPEPLGNIRVLAALGEAGILLATFARGFRNLPPGGRRCPGGSRPDFRSVSPGVLPEGGPFHPACRRLAASKDFAQASPTSGFSRCANEVARSTGRLPSGTARGGPGIRTRERSVQGRFKKAKSIFKPTSQLTWKLVARLLEQKEGPWSDSFLCLSLGRKVRKRERILSSCRNPACLSWRSQRINAGPRSRGDAGGSCPSTDPDGALRVLEACVADPLKVVVGGLAYLEPRSAGLFDPETPSDAAWLPSCDCQETAGCRR